MTDPTPEVQTYAQPPITEAVIGINFEQPISVADIDSVNKKFKALYPHHQNVSAFNVAVQGNQKTKPTAEVDTQNGHRFSNEDMTQLLVIWPTSLTISQLPPYPGWDDFQKRFNRDWAIWKRVIGYRTITRIGVRYINRIDIPAAEPVVEHEMFLNVYPKLPDGLEPLTAYAVQAVAPLPEIGCQLSINSAAVPSPMLNHASFVIDIDISKQVDVPQNDDGISELLYKIRAQKNKIFEGCISNSARKLFKQ